MSSVNAIAARFALPRDEVEELVLDQQAFGRVRWDEFGESRGWSLTEAGRRHGEALLARQLDGTSGRELAGSAYAEFRPLNGRLRDAVSRWQLRPVGGDAFAPNDHRDATWDAAVLAELAELSRALRAIVATMTALLGRFDGYPSRFAAALDRAAEGDRQWVDGVGIDSCHSVWFELHEDFLATLGVTRGEQP